VEITSERFGAIAADDSMTILMAAPVLGFPETSSYVLVEDGPGSPFTWLQSVQQPELAFAAVNPFDFYAQYDFELARADQDDLQLDRSEEAHVLVLISIPPRPQDMTANLVAPIVINLRNRRAKQVVLYDSLYTTRHYLLPEEVRQADDTEARLAGGDR